MGGLRGAGKMYNAAVTAINEVFDRLTNGLEVIDDHRIGLNALDLLEQDKGVVDHFQLEKMFDLRLALDNRGNDGALDILGREKMGELFFALVVVFRTGDDDLITPLDGIFTHAGGDRGIERIVQILDDDADGTVFAAVFQVPGHAARAEIKFLHDIENAFARMRLDGILAVEYSRDRALGNPGLEGNILYGYSFHIIPGLCGRMTQSQELKRFDFY